MHPVFARVFTVLAYLSIGPCLAIPRTASTSFEMAVPPFVGADAPIAWFQLIYTVIFFLGALLVAQRPEKLTDRLGKIMCPVLIALIVITFVGCLVHPFQGYGAPGVGYEGAVGATVSGFLQGYQTMDTIAALVFGIVISLNIRARGVQEQKAVVRGTVLSGVIAGVMLFVIYSMLAHIGALSGGAFPGATNGAVILTNIIPALFGRAGSVLLAAIFVIACFNVCVGLISSCSEYFTELWPKLSYRQWAVIFAVVSAVLANAGLNQILAFSVPVLNIIYPVAIVLIALSFGERWIGSMDRVYPITVLFTAVASVLFEVQRLTQTTWLNVIPLATLGLGWVLPALVGLAIGIVISHRTK